MPSSLSKPFPDNGWILTDGGADGAHVVPSARQGGQSFGRTLRHLVLGRGVSGVRKTGCRGLTFLSLTFLSSSALQWFGRFSALPPIFPSGLLFFPLQLKPRPDAKERGIPSPITSPVLYFQFKDGSKERGERRRTRVLKACILHTQALQRPGGPLTAR